MMDCRICGRSLDAETTCRFRHPEDLSVPQHCRACHWPAMHAARGEGPQPTIPPPSAQDFSQRDPWDPPGKPLPDPRDPRH